MRVLLWMPAAGVIPGGHRIQLEQTAHHLAHRGVRADVSFEPVTDLTGYDLVHGFTLTPEEARQCRRQGAAIALSTIYWNRAYTLGQQRTDDVWRPLKIRSRAALVLLRSALQGRHIEKCEAYVERLLAQRVVYEMADMLLPNSHMEAAAVQEELRVTTPCRVVPNAVDHVRFQPAAPALQDTVAQSEAAPVVYVGRIEPHKNQLGLIRAMRGSRVRVEIIGPPHPHHPEYYARCRREATGNVTLRPGVAHDDLPPLYRAAKVHVLPSWFETTGLVSLEAALCGCSIVTTERGYTREYFGDLAWYCDPADPRSIRSAVEAACEAPRRPELRERILNHYTWEHTAQATAQAYEEVLQSGRRQPV